MGGAGEGAGSGVEVSAAGDEGCSGAAGPWEEGESPDRAKGAEGRISRGGGVVVAASVAEWGAGVVVTGWGVDGVEAGRGRGP